MDSLIPPVTSNTAGEGVHSGTRDPFEPCAERERFLCSQAQYLIPLYVFDEREMELSGLPGYRSQAPPAKTPLYDFWKTGRFRARFIAETVYDLRSRLADRGSDLLIRFGRTEDIVTSLVSALQANGDIVESVWTQMEYAQPDVDWNATIEKRLSERGVPFEYTYGKTLIHPADLPFPISETPDVFTPFRKKVEALEAQMVRPTLEAPNLFKPFPSALPTFDGYALDITYEVDVDGLEINRQREFQEQDDSQVSFHDILRYLLSPLVDNKLPSSFKDRSALQARHAASAFPFRGGESSALERLEWYFIRGKRADTGRWDKNDPPPVAQYKQTRNNLIGHAYSSKMSPFLAFGSVSPRLIWEALDYHEKKFGSDQSTYWVRFELLWRDYFLLVASKQKYGPLLYDLGGFQTLTDPVRAAEKLQPGWWRDWDSEADGYGNEITRTLEGRTGIPFIDANVIEMRATGFMSNRGRQNVASFLSKDLGADWRIGAEFFQSYLIDYDPTSNYGNWQYVAGVGNDPRASRQFNTIKQAKDYDSHGEYVKTWIPALRNAHPDWVHTPWLLTSEERRVYGVKTTRMEVTMVGYPERPIVELETWRKHYERKSGVGSKMRGNPQEKIKDEKIYSLKANAARRRRAAQQEQTQPLSSFNGHMHMQLPRSGKEEPTTSARLHAGQGPGLGFDRAQSVMMQTRSQMAGEQQHGFGLTLPPSAVGSSGSRAPVWPSLPPSTLTSSTPNLDGSPANSTLNIPLGPAGLASSTLMPNSNPPSVTPFPNPRVYQLGGNNVYPNMDSYDYLSHAAHSSRHSLEMGKLTAGMLNTSLDLPARITPPAPGAASVPGMQGMHPGVAPLGPITSPSALAIPSIASHSISSLGAGAAVAPGHLPPLPSGRAVRPPSAVSNAWPRTSRGFGVPGLAASEPHVRTFHPAGMYPPPPGSGGSPPSRADSEPRWR